MCENQAFVEGLFMLVFEFFLDLKLLKFIFIIIFLHRKFHKCAIITPYLFCFKIEIPIFFPLWYWSGVPSFLYVCHVRKYNNLTNGLNNMKMSWLSGWGSYAKWQWKEKLAQCASHPKNAILLWCSSIVNRSLKYALYSSKFQI